MKKFSFYLVLVCLLSFCTLGLFGCEKTTDVTVNWQTGKNYTFVNEDGTTLSGEKTYAKGTVINFSVKEASVLVIIENVTIDGQVATADSDGYYQVTAEKNLSVACTSSVKNNEVQSISVTTLPTKVSYYIDDTFDTTGMVVEATLLDGTKEVVNVYDVVYNDGSSFKLGDTSVTISYTDEFSKNVTTTVDVVVENVTVEAMTVTGTLTTTLYFSDDVLTSIEGLTVELVYSNETTRPLTFADLTVVYETTNATAFTTGDTSFTLKYNDFTYVVEGITVRKMVAYENISAELVVEEGVPSLNVSGTFADAQYAMVVLRENGIPVATAEAIVTENSFSALVDLSVLTKAGTWYDVAIYYDSNKYVDVMDSEAVNFQSAVIYAKGQRWEFKEWASNLKVNFSAYTTANITTVLTNVNNLPVVRVSGICYNVTDLYIYVGDTAYVSAVVNNDTFEATVDLSTLGLAFGTYNLSVATVLDGQKTAITAPEELGEAVEVETVKYSLVKNGTTAAVAIQSTVLPNKAEILTIENVPTLVVTGQTQADALKVSVNGDVVDALISEGTYRAEIDLRNILLIGQGFEILISTDNGQTYTALTKENTTFEGTVDYRLTTSPGGDKYAKNTYILQLNEDIINVSYYQTMYNNDNTVYTIITYFTIDENDKVVFCYPESINTWGAAKASEWIWFAEPVTVDGICTRTTSSSLTKGTCPIEITTAGDPTYQMVYDGNKEFVQLTDKSGFIVTDGKILATSDIAPYKLSASLDVVEGEIVLTITGKYYMAPTGEGSYAASAWYVNSEVPFVCQINEDLTFTFKYTITNTSEATTMYLHLVDNDAVLNMFGTIDALKVSAEITSRKAVLESDNGALRVSITAISADTIEVSAIMYTTTTDEQAVLIIVGATTATTGSLLVGKDDGKGSIEGEMVIEGGQFTIMIILDEFTPIQSGTWYDLTITYGTATLPIKNTMGVTMDQTIETATGTWSFKEWSGDLKVCFTAKEA